jgi:hypothetical protein
MYCLKLCVAIWFNTSGSREEGEEPIYMERVWCNPRCFKGAQGKLFPLYFLGCKWVLLEKKLKITYI